jgi:hypothetical protein
VEPGGHGARWKGNASEPSVGAKFKGKNRNGWRRWSADGTIRTFDVNRVVEWDIRFLGFTVGRWGYQIEPLPDGASRVTETWQDHRNAIFQRWHVPSYIITGQKDRTAANRSGMEATLAKIKATAEAKSRS